jgi:hypothetical protein
MMEKMIPAMAALALLSACGKGGEPAPEPVANQATVAMPAASEESAAPADNASAGVARLPTDAWIGKWVGVEGLALDIQRGTAPGRYALTVQLMDTKNSYEGRAEGPVIRFKRGDKEETISHVTGAETGLKWLADKKNCLVIQPGEGFCRPE